MSGIAGIIRWTPDGCAPNDASQRWAHMIDAMSYWGPDGQATATLERASFAYFHMATTPEDAFAKQPITLDNGHLFTAAARLDNRTELCDALHIDHTDERATLADSALVGAAYLKWGHACIEHLRGDWSLATWDPTTHRLFLARDQLGQTALYYHANRHYFAFASSSKALLALDSALHQIDDLYVTQVLLSWYVHHGARTAFTPIKRLPPAHSLTATATTTHTTYYWRAEEVQPLPLRSRAEAADGLLAHLEQAIHTRLRANGTIAATLSGGLDSSSIVACAAPALAAVGMRLTAYTSMPIGPTHPNTAHKFTNEWADAAQIAAFAGIHDHHPITAQDVSPLAGIATTLAIYDEPRHMPNNDYWLVSMYKRIKADGHKVLLIGQGGNGTISWDGSTARPTSGLRRRLRKLLIHLLPARLTTPLRIWKISREARWRTATAINPAMMQRLRVLETSARDPLHPIHTYYAQGLDARFTNIRPGRNILGALAHQNSAAFGFEIRDPTLDLRLVQYCLAIPEALFSDPTTKTDRAIIRHAMIGRLPESVRLNPKRGIQGADLPHRLRLIADEVEAAIAQLEHGIAADYLNLANLRQAWRYIQQHDDYKALRDAAAILMRGLMVGQFVQGPHPRPLNLPQPTSPITYRTIP